MRTQRRRHRRYRTRRTIRGGEFEDNERPHGGEFKDNERPHGGEFKDNERPRRGEFKDNERPLFVPTTSYGVNVPNSNFGNKNNVIQEFKDNFSQPISPTPSANVDYDNSRIYPDNSTFSRDITDQEKDALENVGFSNALNINPYSVFTNVNKALVEKYPERPDTFSYTAANRGGRRTRKCRRGKRTRKCRHGRRTRLK